MEFNVIEWECSKAFFALLRLMLVQWASLTQAQRWVMWAMLTEHSLWMLPDTLPMCECVKCSTYLHFISLYRMFYQANRQTPFVFAFFNFIWSTLFIRLICLSLSLSFSSLHSFDFDTMWSVCACARMQTDLSVANNVIRTAQHCNQNWWMRKTHRQRQTEKR